MHYGCDTAGYNDDWVHFVVGTLEQGFFESLNIPTQTVFQLSGFHALSEYIRLLTECYYRLSENREKILDSLFHAFLYTLQQEIHQQSSQAVVARKYFRKFSDIRTQMYNHPAQEWNVEQLAKSLCVSVPYFQHLYKEFFGCSCLQDLTKARIETAKYYLYTTNMKICDRAAFCGYKSEVHFMRQFKKIHRYDTDRV